MYYPDMDKETARKYFLGLSIAGLILSISFVLMFIAGGAYILAGVMFVSVMFCLYSIQYGRKNFPELTGEEE